MTNIVRQPMLRIDEEYRSPRASSCCDDSLRTYSKHTVSALGKAFGVRRGGFIRRSEKLAVNVLAAVEYCASNEYVCIIEHDAHHVDILQPDYSTVLTYDGGPWARNVAVMTLRYTRYGVRTMQQ